MRTFFHLLGHELRDRRLLLPAAPLLGCLPHLVAALPLRPDQAADVRETLARVVVFGILFLAGGIFGARWLVSNSPAAAGVSSWRGPLPPGSCAPASWPPSSCWSSAPLSSPPCRPASWPSGSIPPSTPSWASS